MDEETRIHPLYQQAPARHPIEEGIRLGSGYVLAMVAWLGGAAIFQYLGRTMIIGLGLLMWVGAVIAASMVREQSVAIAQRVKMIMVIWIGFLLAYRYAAAAMAHLSSAQIGAALGIGIPQASAMTGMGWTADMIFIVIIGVPVYYLYWLAQTYYAYRGKMRVDTRLDEQQRRRPNIR